MTVSPLTLFELSVTVAVVVPSYVLSTPVAATVQGAALLITPVAIVRQVTV